MAACRPPARSRSSPRRSRAGCPARQSWFPREPSQRAGERRVEELHSVFLLRARPQRLRATCSCPPHLGGCLLPRRQPRHQVRGWGTALRLAGGTSAGVGWQRLELADPDQPHSPATVDTPAETGGLGKPRQHLALLPTLPTFIPLPSPLPASPAFHPACTPSSLPNIRAAAASARQPRLACSPSAALTTLSASLTLCSPLPQICPSCFAAALPAA